MDCQGLFFGPAEGRGRGPSNVAAADRPLSMHGRVPVSLQTKKVTTPSLFMRGRARRHEDLRDRAEKFFPCVERTRQAALRGRERPSSFRAWARRMRVSPVSGIVRPRPGHGRSGMDFAVICRKIIGLPPDERAGTEMCRACAPMRECPHGQGRMDNGHAPNAMAPSAQDRTARNASDTPERGSPSGPRRKGKPESFDTSPLPCAGAPA